MTTMRHTILPYCGFSFRFRFKYRSFDSNKNLCIWFVFEQQPLLLVFIKVNTSIFDPEVFYSNRNLYVRLLIRIKASICDQGTHALIHF